MDGTTILTEGVYFLGGGIPSVLKDIPPSF